MPILPSRRRWTVIFCLRTWNCFALSNVKIKNVSTQCHTKNWIHRGMSGWISAAIKIIIRDWQHRFTYMDMHLSAQLRIQNHLRNDLLNLIAVSFRVTCVDNLTAQHDLTRISLKTVSENSSGLHVLTTLSATMIPSLIVTCNTCLCVQVGLLICDAIKRC